MREAEKLCKEATKLTTPSLLSFRLKGEWEQATPLLERAAMLFRVRRVRRQQQCCREGQTPPHPPPPTRRGCSCLPPPLSALPLKRLKPLLPARPCSNAAIWGVPRSATSGRGRGTSGSVAGGTPPSNLRRLGSLLDSWGSGRRLRLTTAGQQSCLQRKGDPRRQQRQQLAALVPSRSTGQR